jgi:uncharacterized protein
LTVFVDTSAIFAVLDRENQNHALASSRLAYLISRDAVLITSNYVVVECCSLLQRRLGTKVLNTFRDEVLPSLMVQWVSQLQHEIAFASLLASGRRKLSLVDCVSFRIMRDLEVRVAFAFDGHFDEEGFDCGIPTATAR